ncbi:deoxyribodipyrimidine photo-lyase [Aequorivita sp. H23M31]|uniref:Deoxyribodipyrimidine photo-lyase n=1 Tax=Aequorivita ciconiae TaxID=2494375 RepID=A0A410G0J3_9FLAO|nr:deoxyribodipyrimidine photo-lyase [Aequorivita sp. H23M31]QAA80794.1 deoxyribodipyrimidine photo-lyase [Aequorivita sp. H23M31]
MKEKTNVFWFRRDLRLEDNVGFHKALQGKLPLLPIFIFDSEILDELPKTDARVSFIYQTIQKINHELSNYGSGVALFYGRPEDVIKEIVSHYNVQHVICNRDYEPYARKRDNQIEKLLSTKNIGFTTYKDQVIFEKEEIVKNDGDPYIVYTPYMKLWKQNFAMLKGFKKYNSKPFLGNLFKKQKLPNLSLEQMGFQESEIKVPPFDISENLISEYNNKRDYPAKDATSHLGPHLRFGTVGIRQVMQKAISAYNEVFWQELIWREFFMQILWHFPHTGQEAFKKQYDRIEWRNNESDFEKWRQGKTGYPLIDAGMRQLNTTGYMHNRVRMVAASFLCKHLLIDWRWGEAYFAEKLLDYEMSSNVGNWQWAAGSGVDAAPYFRIFNPTTQIVKFDKDHQYIKEWIPELGTEKYPEKMVEHKEARERCLKVYKAALA